MNISIVALNEEWRCSVRNENGQKWSVIKSMLLFIYFLFDCVEISNWKYLCIDSKNSFSLCWGELRRWNVSIQKYHFANYCLLPSARMWGRIQNALWNPYGAVMLCTWTTKAGNCYAQRLLASIIISLPILLAWSLTNQNNAHFLQVLSFLFFTRKIIFRKLAVKFWGNWTFSPELLLYFCGIT